MDENYECLEEPILTPWSFWPTVGFSFIIGFAVFIPSVILGLAFVIVAKVQYPKLDIAAFASTLGSNGLFTVIVEFVTVPLVIGLVLLFAKIRKNITIVQYLSLHRVSLKQLIKWCLVTFVFMACSETLSFLLGRPIVPEYMISIYTTVYFVPLLWFAFIIAAPLSEEIFFRGFLFKSLEHSKIGPIGAVIITSVIWSLLHTQYDLYAMVVIFIGGLLLGFVRLRTNSIYTTIAMHALWNLAATVEVAIHLRMLPAAG